MKVSWTKYNKISIEELNSIFYLKDGTIYWKINRGTNQTANKIAGTTHPIYGYQIIKYKNSLFQAHRISFALANEKWPKEYIDHINSNKLDNRPENLREATKNQNNQNRTKLTNKTSKFKGVSFKKSIKQWTAQIVINKKHYYLGIFKNEIEAANAYNKFIIKNKLQFSKLNKVNENDS